VKGTIKSTDEISTLFKTAQRITAGTVILLISETDDERGPQGRVAFIAGKRLGSAPRRNRAKRLMRHAASLAGVPWFGLNVVFIAREKTTSASLDEVVRDIRTLRRKLVRKEK
jgi:ribonuclease P protein component